MNPRGPRRVTARRAAAALMRAATLCGLVVCGSMAFGQDVTEPSLKAAFIYNFAKFTEWPPDALSGAVPFVACVLGDDPTGDALGRAVKGRLLGGRTVNVLFVNADGPLRSCHLLYISGIPTPQVAQVMASLRNESVLTIGDVDDFDALGGIARMFVEDGRLRFALNFGLAKQYRLQLSSRLLSLASRVRDDPGGVRH
jgi:hypothetical protein